MTQDHFFEQTPEREFDVNYSLDYLTSCLNNLGYNVQLNKYGDNQFPIYKALIFDSTHSHTPNTQKWIGGGKGYRLQGKVSAIAECLQHCFVFNRISNYDEDERPLLSADKILKDPQLNKFKKYATLFAGSNNEQFATLPFHDISDANKILYYPLSLVCPRFDKLKNIPGSALFAWRAHDTGSSLGLSYSEALLHGINEWIERHSFALLIAHQFFLSPKKKVVYVNKNSLPSHILGLINHIERKFSDNLSIILLENEFGIPCILTYFNHQPNCLTQPKGMSSSLNKQYAIEKAVFEALQCRLLRNPNVEAREKSIVSNFKPYTLFLNTYKLALSPDTGDIIDYQDIPDYRNKDINEQINVISQLLEQYGSYKIYTHVFKQESFGLNSLHTLIPGLNESFLIKEGKFIYEKPRCS